MLSLTELMRYYQNFRDARVSDSRCPIERTTRQVYRLLATALYLHSEPLLARLLRGCLAASLKFTLPQAAAGEGSTNPSEKSTIAALDLPATLRFFPAGTGCCSAATYQVSPLAAGDLASRFSGIRGEKMLESRLREMYFPRRCAQLLVDRQLRDCLNAVIDKAVVRLFATAISEGTPIETLASSEDQQLLTRQRQTTGTGTAAVAATSALNTEGSNLFRQHKRQTNQQQHQQQHQQLNNRHKTHGNQAPPQQQPADSAASTTGSVFSSNQQRLCRLHASGSTRQTRAGDSCAVCVARHFLQQHLNRISGNQQHLNRISGNQHNLAKLERTLRDCMQLQSHWGRSLQWIAANVKESRLPEFVLPLVNTWHSDDDCGPSIRRLSSRLRRVSTNYNCDIRKSDSV